MKTWNIEFDSDALKEFYALDGSQKPVVAKAIKKVQQNPLPNYEGGYGKPLGNKGGNDLTGLLKIKLKKLGIRIVYRLVREVDTMKIIVISLRSDNEVYETASKRMNSN